MVSFSIIPGGSEVVLGGYIFGIIYFVMVSFSIFTGGSEGSFFLMQVTYKTSGTSYGYSSYLTI